MTTLNTLLVGVADTVLATTAGLPPVAVVLAAALASAVAVLGVMRAASDQAALATVKRRIHAALLEMRLYNDDLRALLRAQGEVIAHNLRYVTLSLAPLVLTAVPLTLAIAQMQAWYGYDGVSPGEAVEVRATLGDRPAALPRLEGDGVLVAGPARYFPTLGEATWQVVPRSAGSTTLRFVTAHGAVVEKTLVAGQAIGRRSPVREVASLTTQVLYPSEPPLDPASGVTSITVPYPERALRLAGHEVHWLWVYLVATFGFVLALRRPLGVVI